MASKKAEIYRYSAKLIHCEELKDKDGNRYVIAYGVVAPKDITDDFRENADFAAIIEAIAHDLLAHYKDVETPDGCEIVESYIVPADDMRIESVPINKGAWIMGFSITDSFLLRKIANRDLKEIEIALSVPAMEEQLHKNSVDLLRERNQEIIKQEANANELLNRFGISRREVDNCQILCLPENFLLAASKEELYDTNDSVKFYNLLKNAGLKTANSFDLNLNPSNHFSVRKSGDAIWLAVLVILWPPAWDIAKDVLSDFVSDFIRDFYKRYKRRDTSSASGISFEPRAQITLVLRKDDKAEIFEYIGDAAAMPSSLDKMADDFFQDKSRNRAKHRNGAFSSSVSGKKEGEK
jgi:hypothetical protein